jgi:hypothetical protein
VAIIDARLLAQMQIGDWNTDAGGLDILQRIPGVGGRGVGYDELADHAFEIQDEGRTFTVASPTSQPQKAPPADRRTSKRSPNRTGCSRTSHEVLSVVGNDLRRYRVARGSRRAGPGLPLTGHSVVASTAAWRGHFRLPLCGGPSEDQLVAAVVRSRERGRSLGARLSAADRRFLDDRGAPLIPSPARQNTMITPRIPCPAGSSPNCEHDRGDVLDGSQVSRIQQPLVARQTAPVEAGKRGRRATPAGVIQQRHGVHDASLWTTIAKYPASSCALGGFADPRRCVAVRAV